MKKFSIKNGIIKALFNLEWTCNICQNENFDGGYFCKKCNDCLPYIVKNYCNHCGRITPYPVTYCDSCIEKNLEYDMARSLFSYEKPIDDLIKQLKYGSKKYLSEVFIKLMAEKYLSFFSDTEVISFVPSNESTIKERGFNQSKLLAEQLSLMVNVPFLECSFKIKETERQATLSVDKRRENLKGAFKVNRKAVKGKVILIVDDVLTTGVTADILAKLYKKAGAVKVYVLTIASA